MNDKINDVIKYAQQTAAVISTDRTEVFLTYYHDHKTSAEIKITNDDQTRTEYDWKLYANSHRIEIIKRPKKLVRFF